MLRRTSVTRFTSFSWDPIGKVHPDVSNMWGKNCDFNYKGRSWTQWFRTMNQERLIGHGAYTGNVGGNASQDGNVRTWDPEDPRHPIVRMVTGWSNPVDGSVHDLVYGNFGPIPEKSRLLQVLYDNYLEPFSMQRIDPIMGHYSKNNPANIAATDYICPSVSILGACKIGGESSIMHNTVIKGDTGQFWCGMTSQIMENNMFITDAPQTLHHYVREEKFNPYQTWEHTDGAIMIHGFCMIEPGCTIESCHIGMCCTIGHSTRIHKDVKMGMLARIVPGSVVISGTEIGEGELWGGAPARKLGKVGKFDWKIPYESAMHHWYQVHEGKGDYTHHGDQVAYGVKADDELSHLAIEYEQNLSPSTKGQVRHAYEGSEPFTHTVARVTQFWQPLNKQENLVMDGGSPWCFENWYGKWEDQHGVAANSKAGTMGNIKGIASEARW